MKSSQPPLLATWLLEHLVLGGKNEALTGDLLEDFRRRGSVAWYWRQVFMAIRVGCSEELRARRIEIIFAIICSSAVPWEQVFLNFEFQCLLLLGLKMVWPVSLIYQISVLTLLDALALLAAFSVYLGVTKSLTLLRFLNGLFVALFVVSLGNIGLTFLWVLQPPTLLFHIAWRLPLFFGLVLAMWVASPGARRGKHRRTNSLGGVASTG